MDTKMYLEQYYTTRDKVERLEKFRRGILEYKTTIYPTENKSPRYCAPFSVCASCCVVI